MENIFLSLSYKLVSFHLATHIDITFIYFINVVVSDLKLRYFFSIQIVMMINMV